jgi:acylphosphatase
MIVARKVIYTGRVQGVGFRYTVLRLADPLPLKGFVRNLPNGSVELLAEGDAASVESLLGSVEKAMGAYIKSQSITDVPVEGHTEFRIIH